MKLLALSLTTVALVACGGKAHPSTPAGDSRAPWEAKLTEGARFELWPTITEDGSEPVALAVSVTKVEDQGATRVYTLDWGDVGGPTTVRVTGGEVVIGDATAAQMQKPWPGEAAGSTCFAQDFSNPEGCEDVCDAALCFSPTGGIVAIDGLYAPGYAPYRAK